MMTEALLRTYLDLLKLDLGIYKDSIKEVSEEIILGGYSKYPVFIAHQQEIKLGEPILDRDELGTHFTIQASTLEELVEKNIILPENVEKFKSAYKDPGKQCCIFLIGTEGAQFIFVPYQTGAAGNSEKPEL